MEDQELFLPLRKLFSIGKNNIQAQKRNYHLVCQHQRVKVLIILMTKKLEEQSLAFHHLATTLQSVVFQEK